MSRPNPSFSELREYSMAYLKLLQARYRMMPYPEILPFDLKGNLILVIFKCTFIVLKNSLRQSHVARNYA